MEKNTIQKVLRSEITWVITFLAVFWGIVTSIVLPLQSMQIQIGQMQKDLTTQISNQQTLQTSVNVLTTSVGILKSRVDSITKK